MAFVFGLFIYCECERCFTSALATSTSGCRLSISSRALVPPFLTPMIIAPGSRCWVLLGEEEEEDDGDEEEGDEDDDGE